MKKTIGLMLAATVALGTASVAQARDGCGKGFHRGPAGHCRPNRGPGYGYGNHHRPVVGVYYPGRGYWYRNRYWQHRYRHHGDWRYR